MFKLVVLSALLALAAAKPNFVVPSVYGSPLVSAYSSPVYSPVYSPVVSAYSTPVVSAYSSPLVSAYEPALAPGVPAVVSKPTGVPVDTLDVVSAKAAHYTAKALNAHGIHKRSVAYPLAYSTLGHAPVVSAYSAPVVPAYSAYSAPVVSAYSAYSTPVVSAYSSPVVSAYEPALAPGVPAVVNKVTGHPVDTLDVVNARAAHYTAKVLNAHGIHKRSVYAAAPLAYSAVVPASAVSHQSRVDVHSTPVVSAYSAYTSPVVSAAYTTPVVSAYSSPLVSAYSSPLVAPAVTSYSSSVVAAPGIHAW